MRPLLRRPKRRPTALADAPSPVWAPAPDGAPAETWCYAPSTALYFDPVGHVFPCCTGRYLLGSIGGPNGQSLAEIWDGANRRTVVDAVARGDLSQGCAGCALTAAGAGRSAALAIHFDRWAEHVGPWPIDLEFALSNTCNLQCEMCNGDLSSAIRSQREHRPPLPTVYDDRFFEDLAPFLPHAKRIAFKGGEPFLAREARRVMDMLLEIGTEAEIKVTTNGTVWSDRVEELVRGLRMGPIVSIDALDPALLERVRHGVDAEQLWQNIGNFHRVSAECGRPLTLSYCMLTSTWQELRPLLREAERLGGTYVTVAYVDQPLPLSLLSLDPARLQQILDALEAQAAEIPIEAPALITTWDHALDWVRYCRDHADEVVDGVPVTLLPANPAAAAAGVEVPASPDGPTVSTEHVAGAIRELEAWSPLEPAVVTVHRNAISALERPGWMPDSWTEEAFLGHRPNELPAILGELLGLELTLEVRTMETLAASAELHGPDGATVVRALMIRTAEGERIRLAVDPDVLAR